MENNWIWLTRSGVSIRDDGGLFLKTYVGDYVVCTTRLWDGSYEAMVFKAKKHRDGCEIVDWDEVTSVYYNQFLLAYKGHYRLCKKWSKHTSKGIKNKRNIPN